MRTLKIYSLHLFMLFGLLLVFACKKPRAIQTSKNTKTHLVSDMETDKLDQNEKVDTIFTLPKIDVVSIVLRQNTILKLAEEVRPYPVAPGCSDLACTKWFLRRFMQLNLQYPKAAIENELVGRYKVQVNILRSGSVDPAFTIQGNIPITKVFSDEINRACSNLAAYTQGEWLPMISTFHRITKEPIFNPKALSFSVVFERRNFLNHFEGLGCRVVLAKPIIDEKLIGPFNGEIRIKMQINEEGMVCEERIEVSLKENLPPGDESQNLMPRHQVLKILKAAVAKFQFSKGKAQEVTLVYYSKYDGKMAIQSIGQPKSRL